jgi:hypothetical protein
MHDMYATQIIASQALSIVYNSTRLFLQTHLCTLLLHKLKISPDINRYVRLCNTNTDNFNSRSIACAVPLNSIFHCLINLKFWQDRWASDTDIRFLYCTAKCKKGAKQVEKVNFLLNSDFWIFSIYLTNFKVKMNYIFERPRRRMLSQIVKPLQQ